MIRKTLSSLVALLILAAAGQASAQVTLYDGVASDDFFGSEPAGFAFDDFSGQITDTGSSLVVDLASDLDGSNGLFGGIGRDLDPVPDVDPTTSSFRIVYRPLASNTASSFNVQFSDLDSPTDAQDWQFTLQMANGVDLGNGWFEQVASIDPANSGFQQASFGFSGVGDGVFNPGLRQWQIQSGFGSTDRLHIEIQSTEIVSAATVLLGDVDLSGTVDFLDITPFIGVLSGSGIPDQPEADCDESGTVDFLDITPFIAILSGSGS
jgi:hypothetical protein